MLGRVGRRHAGPVSVDPGRALQPSVHRHCGPSRRPIRWAEGPAGRQRSCLVAAVARPGPAEVGEGQPPTADDRVAAAGLQRRRAVGPDLGFGCRQGPGAVWLAGPPDETVAHFGLAMPGHPLQGSGRCRAMAGVAARRSRVPAAEGRGPGHHQHPAGSEARGPAVHDLPDLGLEAGPRDCSMADCQRHGRPASGGHVGGGLRHPPGRRAGAGHGGG